MKRLLYISSYSWQPQQLWAVQEVVFIIVWCVHPLRAQLDTVTSNVIGCVFLHLSEGDVWMSSCEGSKVASISTSTPTAWTHWILSGSLSHTQERNQDGEWVHTIVLRERELKREKRCEQSSGHWGRVQEALPELSWRFGINTKIFHHEGEGNWRH